MLYREWILFITSNFQMRELKFGFNYFPKVTY